MSVTWVISSIHNVRVINVLIFVLEQGRHATQDEITACAFHAVELDRKYQDQPVQIRVTMGKEPKHFQAIFKGKMIIYEVTFIFLNYWNNKSAMLKQILTRIHNTVYNAYKTV